MRFSRRAAAAVPLAAVLALSGCVSDLETYADLQRDREPADELPGLPENPYESVDESSSRYIGEHDGRSLWIAEGVDDAMMCLVVVTDAADWIVGCGDGAPRVSGATGTFGVVADGVPAPGGATMISENVYAQ